MILTRIISWIIGKVLHIKSTSLRFGFIDQSVTAENVVFDRPIYLYSLFKFQRGIAEKIEIKRSSQEGSRIAVRMTGLRITIEIDKDERAEAVLQRVAREPTSTIAAYIASSMSDIVSRALQSTIITIDGLTIETNGLIPFSLSMETAEFSFDSQSNVKEIACTTLNGHATEASHIAINFQAHQFFFRITDNIHVARLEEVKAEITKIARINAPRCSLLMTPASILVDVPDVFARTNFLAKALDRVKELALALKSGPDLSFLGKKIILSVGNANLRAGPSVVTLHDALVVLHQSRLFVFVQQAKYANNKADGSFFFISRKNDKFSCRPLCCVHDLFVSKNTKSAGFSRTDVVFEPFINYLTHQPFVQRVEYKVINLHVVD